jgi:hypothetical protein
VAARSSGWDAGGACATATAARDVTTNATATRDLDIGNFKLHTSGFRPRTANRERRTANRERRTANREPGTEFIG